MLSSLIGFLAGLTAILSMNGETQPMRSQFLEPVGSRDVVTVTRVAEAWVSLIDREAYDESWDRTAEVFRTRVKKEQWIQDLEVNRRPLGKVQSRKLLTAVYVSDLPDSPRGEYVLLDYEVAFETDVPIREVIIPFLAADGEWRVAGYSLK
jgi:hypothetical protein